MSKNLVTAKKLLILAKQLLSTVDSVVVGKVLRHPSNPWSEDNLGDLYRNALESAQVSEKTEKQEEGRTSTTVFSKSAMLATIMESISMWGTPELKEKSQKDKYFFLKQGYIWQLDFNSNSRNPSSVNIVNIIRDMSGFEPYHQGSGRGFSRGADVEVAGDKIIVTMSHGLDI